jgi:hypothetical protein
MGDVRADRRDGPEKPAAFDARTAAVAIAQLRSLLETNDGDAVELFPAVDRLLAGTVEKSRLDALREAINEFDLDGAWKKLTEITRNTVSVGSCQIKRNSY